MIQPEVAMEVRPVVMEPTNLQLETQEEGLAMNSVPLMTRRGGIQTHCIEAAAQVDCLRQSLVLEIALPGRVLEKKLVGGMGREGVTARWWMEVETRMIDPKFPSTPDQCSFRCLQNRWHGHHGHW